MMMISPTTPPTTPPTMAPVFPLPPELEADNGLDEAEIAEAVVGLTVAAEVGVLDVALEV